VDHGGLLNEQTAVHWAVVAGDQDVRGHSRGLTSNIQVHSFLSTACRDEKDLVLAKLGLIASVGDRPVLEVTVAVARA